jgi:hypothetical protein
MERVKREPPVLEGRWIGHVDGVPMVFHFEKTKHCGWVGTLQASGLDLHGEHIEAPRHQMRSVQFDETSGLLRWESDNGIGTAFVSNTIASGPFHSLGQRSPSRPGTWIIYRS